MGVFHRLRLRSEDGFTIVELMVALVVLAVGLLPLFSVLGQGMAGIQRGKVVTVASQIAQDEIEYARTMNYLDVGMVGGDPSGKIVSTGTVTRAGINYSIVRTVTWVDDPSDGLGGNDTNPKDYKKFEVRVSWTKPPPAGNTTFGTYIKPYLPKDHPPVVHAPVATPSYPPGEGGYIKGTVTLMAQATDDDGTISEVQFLFKPDGGTSWTIIGSTSSLVDGYYRYSWNTAGLTGTYLVMAKAWDNAGLVDSTYASVVISNVNPTGYIDSPTQSVTSDATYITGSAFCSPTSSFTRYYIEHDSATFPAVWKFISCAYVAHPGIFHNPPTVTGIASNILEVWDVTGLPDGRYTLRLTVEDRLGRTIPYHQNITLAVPPLAPKLTGVIVGSNVSLSWNDDFKDGPPYSFPNPDDFYSFQLLKPSGGEWIPTDDIVMPSRNTSITILHKYAKYKIRAIDIYGNFIESNEWVP